MKRSFGEEKLCDLSLKGLQAFLGEKAKTLSRSVVAHLRWDLRAIFKLAVAEGYVERARGVALYTPKQAEESERPTMAKEEVEPYISTLEQRERVIAHLAIFCGMRPGEILALQRRHIATDCKSLIIDQRLYRGDIDTPKTKTSARKVAIPPKTASHLKEWMDLVGGKPEA